MSRLIVKNLPSQVTEGELQKLFSQTGTLTEITVKRSSQGRNRHFAFIGYHNVHDADEAIKNLNKTFIKTNKIQIEKCFSRTKGNRRTENRGNKRKMDQSDSRNRKKKRNTYNDSLSVADEILVEKYVTEPDFAEFLDLKSPDQAARVRKILQMPGKNKAENVTSNVELPFKQQRLKRREIINLLYHVKLRDLPRGTKKSAIREFFHPIPCKSIRTVSMVRSIAYVGFMEESQRQRALAKDKSYLKGECVRVLEYNKEYRRRAVFRNKSRMSHRIYFNDLPGISTVEEIMKMFSPYGEIHSVAMPKNANGELKGYGLVTFVNDSDADNAYKELRKTALRNKIVIGPEQSAKVSTPKLKECERTEPIYDILGRSSLNDRKREEHLENTRERSEHRRERSVHSRERSDHTRERSEHSREKSEHTRERSEHSRERSDHTRERSEHSREKSEHTRERSEHSRERSEHTKERSEENRAKIADADSNRSRLDRSGNHRVNDSKPETNRDVRGQPKKVDYRRDYDDKGTRGSVYRIYLRNLPHSTTLKDVERLFRAYGPSDIDMPVDAEKKHTGNGLVSFKEQDLAELAFKELKNTALKEQMILYTGPAHKAPSDAARR